MPCRARLSLEKPIIVDPGGGSPADRRPESRAGVIYHVTTPESGELLDDVGDANGAHVIICSRFQLGMDGF
jgi:hypothetical protein